MATKAKPKARAISAYFPVELIDQIKTHTQKADLDQSKFLRQAAREKLQREKQLQPAA